MSKLPSTSTSESTSTSTPTSPRIKIIGAGDVVVFGKRATIRFGVGLNYDTITAKKYSETYCIVRDEKDPLARWTGRPQDFLSPDEIRAGEVALEQSISDVRKQLEDGKTHPAWSKMSKIVERDVASFQTDFDFHDTLCLSSREAKNPFFWATRSHGTHIADTKGEILRWTRGDKTTTIYFWDGQALRKSTGKGDLLPSTNVNKANFAVSGEFDGGFGVYSWHVERDSAEYNSQAINALGGQVSVETKEEALSGATTGAE